MSLMDRMAVFQLATREAVRIPGSATTTTWAHEALRVGAQARTRTQDLAKRLRRGLTEASSAAATLLEEVPLREQQVLLGLAVADSIEDSPVHMAAIAMRRLRQGIISGFDAADPEVRAESIQFAASCEEYFHVLSAYYIKLFADRSNIVRRAAASAACRLYWFRPPGMIGPLAGLLGDEDDKVSSRAATALTSMGEAARPAEAVLLQHLRSSRAPVRRRAARVLRQLVPRTQEAVTELSRALASADLEMAGVAARTLGLMGPLAAEAVNSLRGLLHARRRYLRVAAAKSLGKIGADARSAVSELVELAAHGNRVELEAATDALVAIEPDAAVSLPVLKAILEWNNRRARSAVLCLMNAMDQGGAA